MKENLKYLSELSSQIDRKVSNSKKQFSAVPISLYSDPSEDINWEWRLSIPKRIRNNPLLLICNLVIIAKENPFWKTSYIEFCAQQCRRYNYEGKWRLLHKLAKLQSFVLIKYRIHEEIPANEFFGNYLPIIVKEYENFQIYFGKFQKPKPKKIQRRRGYNDKGSARKIHEIHDFSTVSGPNKEKLNLDSQYKKKSALLNFLFG